jgi:centractin
MLLRKSGYELKTSAEKEIVRDIKEKICFISNKRNYFSELKNNDNLIPVDYELPDGKIIKIGNERFSAPEILFKPDMIGEEYLGVHHLVNDSIMKADIDLRRTLYSNMVLSGGGTSFKGMLRTRRKLP